MDGMGCGFGAGFGGGDFGGGDVGGGIGVGAPGAGGMEAGGFQPGGQGDVAIAPGGDNFSFTSGFLAAAPLLELADSYFGTDSVIIGESQQGSAMGREKNQR